MKSLRIFLIVTFIITFITGLLAGFYIFKAKHHLPQANLYQKEPTMTTRKQDGIWLIAVDHINTKTPLIKGIWLLAYIPGYYKLIPLPFFPTGNAISDTELVNAFQFDKNHHVSQKFWDSLYKRGQPYNNYIIFDDLAVSEIINHYGGITIDGNYLSGNEIIAQPKNTPQDTQYRLKRQITVMEKLCSSIFNDTSSNSNDVKNLVKKISSHITSNLDLVEQITIYQKMVVSGNHPICEFPDLYKKTSLSVTP